MPDEPAAPAVPETPQETPLEKRLNTILGVTKTLSEESKGRDAQIGELTTLVATLAQKFDSIAARPAAPVSPANQPANPFSGSPRQDPMKTDASLQELVDAAIAKALQPVIADNTQKSERLDKHRTSYARVVARNSNFADPTAPEKQLFDQIYNTRLDLQALPDAPAVIAEIVTGLVADQRIEAASKEIAKSRAALPTSGGRGVIPGEPQKVRDMFQALQAKGERGILTPKEQEDYLHLALANATLRS